MKCMISDLEVEVDAQVDPGEPASFDHPGDPGGVEVIHAWLVSGDKRIDIVDYLDEAAIEELEEQAGEQAYNAEEAAYDAAMDAKMDQLREDGFA